MVVRREMPKTHDYHITTEWTGNLGSGTANYRAYSRNHQISAAEKTAPIHGSSDPHFRGDGARYNPEELLEKDNTIVSGISRVTLRAEWSRDRRRQSKQLVFYVYRAG